MSEATPAQLDRPHIRLTTSSGSIRIVAESRDDIEIDSGGSVERLPSPLREPLDVKGSRSVEVRCPLGTDVVAGTSSGSIRLFGSLGDVRVTSQSGRISVEEVAAADLRTTSGRVDVERCHGGCRVTTTSGSVEIREAGAADVRGVSATVHVAGRTARIRTVSGTVVLDVRGDASVETVSGRITISLPPQVHPRVLTRGLKRPKIKVDQGDDCEISVRSVSGSVTIRAR